MDEAHAAAGRGCGVSFGMSFGEIINLLVLVGMGGGFLLRYERRLTALETHLLHLLPKRSTDVAP